PGGSPARAEVAQEIQRLGARPLGRPHLRQRADTGAPLAPGARLSRHLGRRAVSVPLRACPEPSRFTAPDAGMVSGGRDPDGTVDGELDLEPSQAPVAAAPRLRLTAAGAGVPERGPCFLQRRVASRCGPAQAAVADGRAPPAPAAGAPAWPAAIRPGARAAPPRLGRGPPERSSRQSPSRSVSASSSSVPAPPLSSPGPSGGLGREAPEYHGWLHRRRPAPTPTRPGAALLAARRSAVPP